MLNLVTLFLGFSQQVLYSHIHLFYSIISMSWALNCGTSLECLHSLLHALYTFNGTGLPFTSSAALDVKRNESGLSVELALHAGAQDLKLTLQKNLHNSTEITGGLLVSAAFLLKLSFQNLYRYFLRT